MRTLQVFGIFVGVLIGLYGFWKYKRGAYNRTNFLISIGLAAGLLIISVFPSAGDFIVFPSRWIAGTAYFLFPSCCCLRSSSTH